MKDFRQLKVWEKAHQLALAVYQATRDFPREEGYGETAQLRRAAASVAANLAEGCGRASDSELARFVSIAAGSASELKYHFLLARDLGWLSTESYAALEAGATEVMRMLNGLRSRLKSDGAPKVTSKLIADR
jgi:four helix bundle protein